MSSDIVIRVENLSKRYVLKHASGQRSGDGLRHAIQDAVTSPFRRLNAKFRKQRSDTSDSGFRSPLSAFQEDFYALKDVSFEVRRGEVLGIIGRNGAGKSTLLKILSRITEPTKGRIGVKGRVASLLEVGTGFHPELTGRENIFLNGAILGMTRREVGARYEEIIEFAEVSKFLDTPVKYYSSGMYVRLAFAVAAHLDPEILIVDEVLAVGDAAFQKKCLGKLKEVTQEKSRTVLFVSHNLHAVAAFCDRCAYLSSGKLVGLGRTDDVLSRYRSDMFAKNESGQAQCVHRSGYGTHRITEISPAQSEFQPRHPLDFSVSILQYRQESPFHFSMHFKDDWDSDVFAVNTEYLEECQLAEGTQQLQVTVKSPALPPGNYRIDAFLYSNGIIDHWPDACRFSIGPDVTGGGYSHASARNAGKVLSAFSIKARTEGPKIT